MDRFALIVGIAQYGTKSLPQLEKPTADAEAVAQVLEQYGDFTEVQRLPSRINPETKKREMVNQPVTAKELWQAIETLLNEQARNNDALIYFTGHGLKVEGRSGKPRGYLATSDCQIKADVIKSEGNKDEPRITEVQSAILFDDLNDLISKSELSSLVVLLDCCHSGNFIERNLITNSFGISLEKDYYLIAACRGFQTGKARKSEKNSVFTGALLRGLRAENASSDGEISCDRLYDYISRELRRASQQPLKLGWGTSIILVNHPPALAPPVDEVPAAPAVVNRDNPYLGLMAFDGDKKDYFFGRKGAVRAIGERLSNSRFLAVIGPSGCGKSSLVKAGVLPELKRDLIPDSTQWQVKVFTPGRYPLEELEQALASLEPGKISLLLIDQFEELFTLGSDESQQREFISQITREATKPDGETRVIVAIRGDFLDRCARYQETANLINCTQPTTYLVTPMTRAELTEAIEQPAEKHVIAFESGLVEQIITDVVNQAGALPLLQYALAELWRVCVIDSNQSQPQLTFNGYEQIRGVKGALEKRADELYQDLAEADRAFVRRLFLELVQLGENQEVTRRHASWQDLLDKADSQEQLDRVTRQLANWNQRLIITDENKVEVAHEALLSEWRRLREWIEDNRDNIRLERRLEGDCQEWNKQNRPEGLLLTGTWLAAIDEWVNQDNPRLSPLESEFLRESLGRRDRAVQDELEQQRQLRELAEAKAKAEAENATIEHERAIEAQKRADAEAENAKNQSARADAESEKVRVQKQRTWLAIASGLLAAFTLSFGLLANQRELEIKKRELQVEQQKALNVYALINNAKNLLETNNQIEALLASLEALAQLKELGSENPSMLNQLQSIINGVQEHNRLVHPNQVTVVNFNPKSKEIASATSDGTIWLWSKEGKIQRKISGLSGHKEVVWSLSFSPDGQKLASASGDKTIKIWSATGELLTTLVGHTASVYDVKFSSDSNNVVSASGDGSVRLWDVKTGELLKKLENKGKLLRLDFSRNGSKVAFIGNDNSVNIWNLQEKDSKIIGRHENVNNSQVRISYVVFNWDSNLLASSDYKGFIKLWDVETNQVLMRIDSKKSFIHGLAFSPDSKMIASANGEATIKLWKLGNIHRGVLTKQPEPEIVKGHRDEVVWVNFLPQRGNIKIMASASDDTMIKIWRIGDKVNSSGDVKKIVVYGCNSLKDYFNTQENLSSKEKQTNKFCELYYNK